MQIQVRFVDHLPDEITLGQILFYRPDSRADGISVTANTNGFTTLRAVARAFETPEDNLMLSALHANRHRGKELWCSKDAGRGVAVWTIPQIRGEAEAREMTTKLLGFATAVQVECLELTHFHFIQGGHLWPEIAAVLEAIHQYPQASFPKSVLLDVDSRRKRDFLELYGSVCGGEASISSVAFDSYSRDDLSEGKNLELPDFLRKYPD